MIQFEFKTIKNLKETKYTESPEKSHRIMTYFNNIPVMRLWLQAGIEKDFFFTSECDSSRGANEVPQLLSTRRLDMNSVLGKRAFSIPESMFSRVEARMERI